MCLRSNNPPHRRQGAARACLLAYSARTTPTPIADANNPVFSPQGIPPQSKEVLTHRRRSDRTYAAFRIGPSPES